MANGYDWTWSWTAVAAGGAVVLVVGALVALGVVYLEAQNRRDSLAARLQSDLTASLRTEPDLAGVSILPVTTIPRTGPASIELSGTVPSARARDRAIALMERELRTRHPDATIVDRLKVTRAA